MTYTGRVQNGVVVFDNGADLAEGTLVRVEPIGTLDRAEGGGESLFDIGSRAVRIGQSDLATNFDHYPHCHPK